MDLVHYFPKHASAAQIPIRRTGAGACIGDINNDGDLDLRACIWRRRSTKRQRRQWQIHGRSKFGLDITAASVMLSFVDCDLDGYLLTNRAPTGATHPTAEKETLEET